MGFAWQSEGQKLLEDLETFGIDSLPGVDDLSDVTPHHDQFLIEARRARNRYREQQAPNQ